MKIIDMHAHIWMYAIDDCKYKIMRTAAEYGIDKVFISTLWHFVPDEAEISDLNKTTLEFMREEPEVIRGYVNINPLHKNAIDVLSRGIEDKGMLGVKIWVPEKCDHPSVFPLAEKIIEYGVPFLIHSTTKAKPGLATESTSVNVRNLALRYPELKIIMAHIDGNCYRGAQNVRELKNVFVDFSGSTGRAGEIEYAVEQLGDDRILFGTDLAYGSFAVPYGRLLEAKVSEQTREKILYKNTEKLFTRGGKL